MKKKILCMDVDGTIVAREGNFYPGVEIMCQTLFERGWNIVLCSARPVHSLCVLADKLCGINWVCGLGGAVIAGREQHYQSGENLTWKVCHHDPFIDHEAIYSVYNWAQKYSLTDIWAYDLEHWFIASETERVKREAYITGMHPSVCSGNVMKEKELLKLVFPHVPKKIVVSLKQCAEASNLVANYSTDTQVEINTLFSQDKGIKVIGELLGNDMRTHIVALGDGANDYGMLLHSDVPITFSDAHSTLLSIARHVLSSDREHAYQEMVKLMQQDEQL